MKNYFKYAIKDNSIKTYISSLKEVTNKIKGINGKNKFLIMIDIISCTIKYSSSPKNYLKFKFYQIDNKKRSTYVTHGMSKKLISKYNNDAYREIFEIKTQFAERFKDYFNREWISNKGLDFNNFEKFINNKEQVIFKPIDSSQGQGIEKLRTCDFKDYKQMYNYILKKHRDKGIIEDWIVQHNEISRLYEGAVNNVRVITIRKNGEFNILVARLTIGNGGDISNPSCGDLIAPIDIKSGIIKYPAEDLEGRIYSKHPITGEKIAGFKIPYWKETVQLLERASKVVPEVNYVGWDIAITLRGPILIEGNTSPGYGVFQLPSHLPDQIGMKPVYDKFL